MARRWLITGATGLLAPYIIAAASDYAEVITTARAGADRDCDLSDLSAARALLEGVAPDIVVHSAGLTDVERCEREPAAALAANRDMAANLAAALPPTGRLVVISTDQVYPDTAGPHRENTTGPVNVYGKSKLAGERAALAHPRALVLRTNFFGPSRTEGRQSLSDFVVASLSQNKPVTLFDDVFFSPLHMATLAELVVTAAERELTGVFNAGSRNGMSKADFALGVARHLRLPTASATIGSSKSMPGRAPRTSDLRMDISRIEQAMGVPMPTLTREIERL
jgi:dTDP-4-dehydrorhamnose reductase